MATKEFYHNIDLVGLGQLLNTRKQNLTTTERNDLAATLGAANEGLFVWDTTLKTGYTWDGTQFVAEAAGAITGDVIFKGFIDDLTDPVNVELVSGYQYVSRVAGTLTITGVTFNPSAVVEIGDVVLITSATEAYIFQRNDVQATETQSGNIRLATQAEVDAGVVGDEAVTPATLKATLNNRLYTRQYFATVTLTANTPLTVTHNLNLVDRDAFVINTMRLNSQISLDVDSIDTNTLTLRSVVGLANVKVTITGASTV